MFRVLALLAAALLSQDADKSYPILKIEVEGNRRFTAEAVIAASQLKTGVAATVQDFAAVCERLSGTGLFSVARYRYKSAEGEAGPGFDLTLVVEEEQDLHEARIELPGIEDAAVWLWLEQNEPLVKKQVPANDAANAYYTRAIGRFLAGQGRSEAVISRLLTDPPRAAVVTLFRPAQLPRIVAVRFEGAQAVASADLEKALAAVAVGAEYTERSFRETLDYNVRRLYEVQGRLNVRFPRVRIVTDTAGGVSATTSVEEGAVFRVSAFAIEGDHLPLERLEPLVDLKPGDVANWQKVTRNAEQIRSALGRDGYLDAATEIERALDEAASTVAITVLVQKGTASRFGALRLEGLEAASAARAHAWWKLAPGAALNTDRVDEFEATLMRDSQIRFKRISRRYEPNPSNGAVDVVFTFR